MTHDETGEVIEAGDRHHDDRAPRRRTRRRTLAVGALTAGGLALAGAGVAGAAGVAAADSTPAPTPSPSVSSGATTPDQQGTDGARGWHGHRGLGGRGGLDGMRGMGGGALHGEFVVPKAGGGYQTVDVQSGQVTAVSANSISLKSEDGFTQTYTVTADTLVNASRDGISTVKVDDRAQVVAVKDGDSRQAVRIGDLTQLRDARQRFAPGRPDGTTRAPSDGSTAGSQSSDTGWQQPDAAGPAVGV